MYQIQFFKANGGTDRIYVRGNDLNRAKLYVKDHGHTIIRIDKMRTLEWLFYAYIKESHNRFKRWWV